MQDLYQQPYLDTGPATSFLGFATDAARDEGLNHCYRGVTSYLYYFGGFLIGYNYTRIMGPKSLF